MDQEKIDMSGYDVSSRLRILDEAKHLAFGTYGEIPASKKANYSLVDHVEDCYWRLCDMLTFAANEASESSPKSIARENVDPLPQKELHNTSVEDVKEITPEGVRD